MAEAKRRCLPERGTPSIWTYKCPFTTLLPALPVKLEPEAAEEAAESDVKPVL